MSDRNPRMRKVEVALRPIEPTTLSESSLRRRPCSAGVSGDALTEIALASWGLRPDATIVEIGVFMGRSTVLLAGARRLRGSGKVHCVDPFDCSGDAFSIPHYLQALKATGSDSLEEVFRRNMSRLGVEPWIELHRGTSRDVGASWSSPIDFLLLDGDQSPVGAREAYDTWVPFLNTGGTIVLGNIHDDPSRRA